jgi:predicted RNA binding protein YcfA (HicA-like mRNA interferase family)
MPKPGRKLPPLTAADFKRVLRAAGWVPVKGTKHLAYEHPEKPGKVNLDEKWRNVKPGSWVFRSVVRDQAGMTPTEFAKLYWRTKKGR